MFLRNIWSTPTEPKEEAAEEKENVECSSRQQKLIPDNNESAPGRIKFNSEFVSQDRVVGSGLQESGLISLAGGRIADKIGRTQSCSASLALQAGWRSTLALIRVEEEAGGGGGAFLAHHRT